MKILPNPKLLIIAFIIALVLNFQQFLSINSSAMLIAALIDTFIIAIVLIVVFRIILWIAGKLGMNK